MITEETIRHRIQSVQKRLESINWFEDCGQKVENSFLNIECINSWAAALDIIKSDIWDHVQNESSNEITSFLHKQEKSKYQQWNNIVREAKKYVNGPLDELLQEVKCRNNLDQSFVDSVKWDILNGMMGHVYQVPNMPTFYTELMDIYESGHLPCGWNGTYPEGKLIVF